MTVPTISLKLPRPVTSYHQFEITSRCNLRCKYCPSSTIMDGKPGRPAMDMTMETFLRALEHVKYHVGRKEQSELNLAGIGEPTLHPNLLEFLRLARLAAPGVFLNFTTNGLLFTEELAKEMNSLNAYCFVSLHAPSNALPELPKEKLLQLTAKDSGSTPFFEKAGRAVEIARQYGVLLGTSQDPINASISWAGQVEWAVTAAPGRECPWIRKGRVMVRADGWVTKCCYDAGNSPDSIVGHVNDPVGSLVTQPYSLCKGCEQEIAVEGHQQRT